MHSLRPYRLSVEEGGQWEKVKQHLIGMNPFLIYKVLREQERHCINQLRLCFAVVTNNSSVPTAYNYKCLVFTLTDVHYGLRWLSTLFALHSRTQNGKSVSLTISYKRGKCNGRTMQLFLKLLIRKAIHSITFQSRSEQVTRPAIVTIR